MGFMAGGGRPTFLLWVPVVAAIGCTSLPDPQVHRYSWPKAAYKGEPDRAYKPLGLVRTKVTYVSLDPHHEEQFLCQNAFNQAARDLVKRAKDAGGDAVAGVQTVTFLISGATEKHDTAECTDDGAEGQLLAQGVAVKWTGPPTSPKPAARSAGLPKKPAPVAEEAPRAAREAELPPEPSRPQSPADAPAFGD